MGNIVLLLVCINTITIVSMGA